MLKGSKKSAYDRKDTKYTNKNIVMCLVKKTREKVTFKNNKSVSTFGRTNSVHVVVLDYEYKFPTCLHSCEFKKEWMVQSSEAFLDTLKSW